MKIHPKNERPYNPIVLTLECPEDTAKLYALFNNATIAEALKIPLAWIKDLQAANESAGNPDINHQGYSVALSKILK